jgi:hypothetical protein|tara:strand:- start:328 stop:891 length:564 start_codon:yes stop_codon:yes gene_type:complete
MSNTRENWLMEAIEPLQATVFGNHAIPGDVRITCGFPSKGATAKRTTIGECWPRSRSANGVNEIFISPLLDDSVDVLAVLVHELVHAIDDCQHGHGKEFRDIAIDVGLTGKMTATTATPELAEQLAGIQAELGNYPHGKLTPPGPKQKARQLKMTCLECDAVWRMAKSWMERATVCPCCAGPDIQAG